MKKSFLGLGLKIYAPINFTIFVLVLLYLNSDSVAVILPTYITILAVVFIAVSSLLIYAVGEILSVLYETTMLLNDESVGN